jgi:hypothetical protein
LIRRAVLEFMDARTAAPEPIRAPLVEDATAATVAPTQVPPLPQRGRTPPEVPTEMATREMKTTGAGFAQCRRPRPHRRPHHSQHPTFEWRAAFRRREHLPFRPARKRSMRTHDVRRPVSSIISRFRDKLARRSFVCGTEDRSKTTPCPEAMSFCWSISPVPSASHTP